MLLHPCPTCRKCWVDHIQAKSCEANTQSCLSPHPAPGTLLEAGIPRFRTMHFFLPSQNQDAACSPVEHFSETSYLDSLVHFSPVTVPVHCRLWNAEEGGVQSVECGV